MVFKGIKGILGVVPTPIDKNGYIDEEGYRKNIDLFIESGCGAVIATGTFGEWYKLSFEEHKRVIEIFVDQIKGRVPSIVGTSRLDWEGSLKMTEHAAKVGSDVVMSILPFYEPADRDDTFKFFSEVASVSRDLQVMIYNTKMVSKVNVDAEMLKRLTEVENITGIKEMSADINDVYPKILAGGDKIKLYAVENTFLPFWAMGAKNGSLFGFTPLDPTLMGDLYEALLAGDMEKARNSNDRLRMIIESPLFKLDMLEFGRVAYELTGIPVTTGYRRKPFKTFGPEETKQIEQLLKQINIL